MHPIMIGRHEDLPTNTRPVSGGREGLLTAVASETGKQLDAKIDVEDGKVVLHSRGGAFGKPSLYNPDYREALSSSCRAC